ncbi:hypothetical protein CspeluHIS016_0108980 [Cutaneotrichosporon spelunceum]|uniref:Uncharacterized protein n=1 Tax=Cutaneotrichosporon spelunceum TaxID=1672016 RepID=A0AAD3TPU5_9TREE|nr:hypothetical protein CspeluHIS016_0108980 [Cutaneotrichosporon spelunceum]
MSQDIPLRASIPNLPVRLEMAERQAGAVREAYLAERLAQIDAWAYDRKPWGPAELPVPSSLVFGRDPRARVRARVEDAMREAVAPPQQRKEADTNPAEMPEAKQPTEHNLELEEHTLKDKRCWSMLNLKSAAEAHETGHHFKTGPPSAFKRWSPLNPNDAAAELPHPPTMPALTHMRSASETTMHPAPLKRNRRWSLQNLKEALVPPTNSATVPPKEETIITHLPKRISSISPTQTKKPTPSTLPSPTLSMASLDLDFDMFGLSSDSQSVKTPESANSVPDPLQVHDSIPTDDPQLHVERDAWRHEALLLYDQMSYWRLEALERGRERDGWRRIAVSAGAQVPASVAKSLPPSAAPLSEAQRRVKEVEREREKGRERVRQWHLASIERERVEHAAREAERRAAARENADRKELDRRVRERRAWERHGERGMARREGRAHSRSREWPAGRHSRQPSYEWAIPSPAAEAAADAMAVVGAAPAGVQPPPGLPGLPGHMSPLTGSCGRQSHSSGANSHRFPVPRDYAPEHEHDARSRAVGWPASESGRERAREMLTPPRIRQAVRSGTA